jgi:hypothetical protein
MPSKVVTPAASSSAMTGARSAGSVRTRCAGFIGDARGAVAQVATGWHCRSVPAASLMLRKPPAGSAAYTSSREPKRKPPLLCQRGLSAADRHGGRGIGTADSLNA